MSENEVVTERRNMIKNIVFDLGRVLLRYEPKEYLLAKYAESTSDILYDNIFASSIWLDLDRGIITNEKAVEIISANIPEYKDEICYLLNNWTDLLEPVGEMVNLLYDLNRSGYQIYLITNFHKDAFYKVFGKYEFFEKFNKYVLSSEVKMLKPERGIFEYLCDYCNIIPNESVFIDDSYPNIETANKMGFKCVHFINSGEAVCNILNRLKKEK